MRNYLWFYSHPENGVRSNYYEAPTLLRGFFSGIMFTPFERAHKCISK